MTQKNNAITWFAPEMGELEIKLVTDVIKSNYINDGAVTTEFENKIADFLKVKHCIAVTSGTAAITLALMGLGVGHGDEVIVPDFTFIATANAVRLTGATVKLVDIEPERLSIDIEKIKEAINEKTKAIVSVDVNGRGADYQQLEKICKQHNLSLVCDSAEALGSKYKEKYLGTFGNAGCFSFSANKTLSTGQGGMIATNDSTLHDRLRELKDQGRRHQGTGGDDLHPVLGFNFKLTNIQAAVGLAQFTRLSERLAISKKRDELYRKILADHKDIHFPKDNNDGEVRQWTDILSDKRDAIKHVLSEANISSRPFWFPLHRQKPYAHADNGFNNSIKISNQGLWLPSSFSLTEEQIHIVCDTLYKKI